MLPSKPEVVCRRHTAGAGVAVKVKSCEKSAVCVLSSTKRRVENYGPAVTFCTSWGAKAFFSSTEQVIAIE